MEKSGLWHGKIEYLAWKIEVFFLFLKKTWNFDF